MSHDIRSYNCKIINTCAGFVNNNKTRNHKNVIEENTFINTR